MDGVLGLGVQTVGVLLLLKLLEEAQFVLWSQDNFGEDLIFNQRDGFVFYWDKSLGTSTRAQNLIELSDQAPIKSRKVIVSERDRHVICFGANPLTVQRTR